MMTKSFNTFALAAYMLASTTTTTKAVLSPDATKDLKDNANAVMLLAVTNVMPRPPDADAITYDANSSCMNYYSVEANIIDIAKQDYVGGLQAGNSLTFDSWYYDYSDPNCEGSEGPESPPLITNQANWCGYVWLNFPDLSSGDDWILAANGDSFDKEPAAMCTSPGNYDTATAPPNDGGSTRRLGLGNSHH